MHIYIFPNAYISIDVYPQDKRFDIRRPILRLAGLHLPRRDLRAGSPFYVASAAEYIYVIIKFPAQSLC